MQHLNQKLGTLPVPRSQLRCMLLLPVVVTQLSNVNRKNYRWSG